MDGCAANRVATARPSGHATHHDAADGATDATCVASSVIDSLQAPGSWRPAGHANEQDRSDTLGVGDPPDGVADVSDGGWGIGYHLMHCKC